MRHLIPPSGPAVIPADAVSLGHGEPAPVSAPATAQIWTRSVLNLLLVFSFGSVVLGIFHQSVSTDEFIFLHGIHRAANDEPMGLLQTAYTHLFGWLTLIEGGELVQIRVGRLIQVVFWACSLVLLDRLGRRLTDPFTARAGV